MIDLYLEPVRLLNDDYREEGVETGAIGVVVEVWGDGFLEVEFSNPANGETIALLTLPESTVARVDRTDSIRNAKAGD